jgi:hypothetical protein
MSLMVYGMAVFGHLTGLVAARFRGRETGEERTLQREEQDDSGDEASALPDEIGRVGERIELPDEGH